ncbi:MAG: DJ-1/PfpI family protein [Proteobacteria bacterium]|nr:DJ-1/PfpI family protein [Pseudomonadota bacterium]
MVAFDNFTDIDVFLLWDVLKRVNLALLDVKILSDNKMIASKTGISIVSHERWSWANECDGVLFSSGPDAKELYRDPAFLKNFSIDLNRQFIGSICSGSLILASLGLLNGKTATTYPTTRQLLVNMGVEVVEKPIVIHSQVATAAGCLAGEFLVRWLLEKLFDRKLSDQIGSSIRPLGDGLTFDSSGIAEIYSAVAEHSHAQSKAKFQGNVL